MKLAVGFLVIASVVRDINGQNGNFRDIIMEIQDGITTLQSGQGFLQKSVDQSYASQLITDGKVDTLTRTTDDILGRVIRVEDNTNHMIEEQWVQAGLINNILTLLNQIDQRLENIEDCCCNHTGLPQDCSEVSDQPSGQYTILPPGGAQPVNVYCNNSLGGGGWTVIQRRTDGSEDFNRNWADYEAGFGDLDNEFWLGNSIISALTMSQAYQLRVDVYDLLRDDSYALYDSIVVEGPADLYRMTVSGYSGTAGDALGYSWHNTAYFTTSDQDNDIDPGRNCAATWGGAWWYNYCLQCNLNGQYIYGGGNNAHGIIWNEPVDGHYESMLFSEMKIKPF